jgi:hypothetical protein
VVPNGGVKSKKYILETTGSALALFDYDSDGFVDIFVASGEGGPSRMYRNRGRFRFEETGAGLGLTRTGGGDSLAPDGDRALAQPTSTGTA